MGTSTRATLAQLYNEIENRCRTPNRWWREKIRQAVQRDPYQRLAPGLYALPT
jgi:hypothetical protein